MVRDFEHAGRKFSIEAFPIGDTGKFGCAIFPMGVLRGIALFEPDAVYTRGKLVDFESEEEAIAAGEAFILGDFLR